MRAMRVEYTESPLALGTRSPRFSWDVPFEGRGRTQQAYHVLVATEKALLEPGKADLWDSGRVESTQSVHVAYTGKVLRSNMDCYWAVQLWDESGHDTGFSTPAFFGTALFDESDWTAQWIGMADADEPVADPATFQQGRVAPEIAAIEPDDRAPMLRKAFCLDTPVRRARVFVCGLGLYELRLNGQKVGDDVLSTPRTEFRKKVIYNTYDVTDMLRAGENALGVILGNGWFNGHKKFWGWQQQWYGSPRGIVQLVIEQADGSSCTIASDASWKGAFSPITNNCIYDGEIHDARLAQEGWDAPGFDASAWAPVAMMPAPGGRLTAALHEPGQVVERFAPVSVCEPVPGTFVYDMGRNMTGWGRLTVKGGAAGDTVTLRFGEAQHADGSLNNSSNNRALQRDQFILRGGDVATFEPRFTYHGFQYVEVTGYPGTPGLDTLEACFVRTDVEQTGTFACGHELINKIHACTLQSQMCNIQMGVPTDDTQRPERLGWAGDVWSFAQEAFYNLSCPRVFAKWIADFCDQQDETGMVGMIVPQAGAEEDLVWSAAFVLVPWWQYVHYGDRRLLQDAYPALKRYLAYLEKVGRREIQPMPTEAILNTLRWKCDKQDRVAPEGERGYLQLSQWGDHLATNEGASGFRKNQPLSIATAFYHMDVRIMARIAEVLGEHEDVRYYQQLAEKIKAAFNARFLDAESGYYDVGCQSAQAWALAFDLVPEAYRDAVQGYLCSSINHRQRRLTTGYAGTKWAIKAVADAGRDDIVWNLATLTHYPSWGYMLRDPKRTTITENWMGKGGSLCHTTLGAAIDEWFYWGLAGIRPDPAAPGFERIIFKPYMPADLPWAKATLQTRRGLIVSDWEHDGTTATLRIRVPANSTATVYLPVMDADTISESGGRAVDAEGVAAVQAQSGQTSLDVGSGSYSFTFPRP